MKLEGHIVDVDRSTITCDGQVIQTPFQNTNLKIYTSGFSVVVFSTPGVEVTWNFADRLQVKLDDKYINQTCGVCGDFNGFPVFNEFSDSGGMEDLELYFLKNTLKGAHETCYQSAVEIIPECQIVNDTCKAILESSELSTCANHFDNEAFMQICSYTNCLCGESPELSQFCFCSAITEYARQCAIASGIPENWRNTETCPIQCPASMVYKECGTSCERSCSNQELIACDQSCIMGCFCPNDTVYDDVKETGCIQASECYCKYSGQIYPPGSFINTPCQNCDHGEVCQNSLFTVHGEFKSCNQNEGETCLTKVVLSLDDTNTIVVIKNTGEVLFNSETAELPAYINNVTVFQPTTFYIIVDTYLGLRLDIQLIPIMQVYINLNTTYSDLTCGLCGNYNSKQQDDFTTPDGMTVQDLSIFTYSWRSLQTCPHVPVVITDPCTNNFMNATYAEDCDSSMRYQELVASCQPTCKSLSHHDPSCSVNFIPIDGCVCKKDTYLTEDGNCVTMKRCPCYYMGDYINPGEETSKNGIICTCINGKLECEAEQETKDCTSPMTYFNCSVVPEGATGIECLKSCQNQDVPCYSTDCISGCVCPTDMLADGKGGCVTSDTCTCIHNDIIYDHKQSTRIGCSMCTCNNQKWDCENNDIMAECTVYGEGNYITFDQKQYRYNGQCQYTLVQDYCGYNVLNGTFRIMSENTKCGTSGTTCSKSITVLINDFRLVLSDGNMQLTNFGDQLDSPFQIRNSSIYLIIKVSNGIVLTWDKKTSIIIKVTPSFQNKLCGLCGNYDGNSLNDFNTRGHFQVADVIEFGNSWKLYPTCPEITSIPEPCEMNPFRKTWAQRKCSIILSEVFQPCHAQVDPSSYYDACVKDSCGCNEGGDCDCFCTAVAMYAQACLAQCVCVEWRNPNLCPVFCDYYNREGNCEWHYRACGPNCMKTCQNPSGICSPELFKVEGCYPTCPDNKPYFEETGMSCVEVCGCYDQKGKYYHPGEIVLSCNNCESW
ncbi:mucin-5AC [Xenopus tropicalis]|uniref:Mucin-5AC n=1 Tax=Xenopus tropicalis TaxID=8364 RepID=A0A8J1JH25_XENTR|nr:mucin-5AC [Xenopus tropicalis]